MTEQPLSSIERVDLRTAWPNEAADFTPWLEKNLSKLGDALGMDLEFQEREAPVGGYSLDILATDVNRNRLVVIENQLDSTDHDHLGKLLTYAAGKDASVVVWLTREFRDQHRQALDWLNNRTGEDTHFFGVVVELWRIDDSRPAPNFKLVAYPNDWRKESARKTVTRGTTPKGERYQQFFQKLLDTLREEHRFTGVRKANPHGWADFSIGYGRRAYLQAKFRAERRASIEVYIEASDAEANLQLFRKLEKHKAQIEKNLGQPLEWEPLENRKACRIAAYMPGNIDDDEETLTEIRDWMVVSLLRFKKVFDPHLKREMARR